MENSMDRHRDTVTLVRPNGEKIEGINAGVQPTRVFIDDQKLVINEGDYIERILPNGKLERYLVHEANIYPRSGYQLVVKRDGILSEQAISTTHNYFYGSNARVNNNSTDNSINVAGLNQDETFRELRNLLQGSTLDSAVKSKSLTLVDEMESTKGTKTYLEKYIEFVSVLADHAGLVAAFIPALTQWLSPS
jgi:hypothetical protein